MKRTAIISYVAIPGIPIGLHQQGNCDIFSRDYEKIRHSDSEMLHKKKAIIEELHVEVMKHIDEYDTIFILMGRFAPGIVGERDWPIFEMLKQYYYNRRDNKVTIVGCKCSSEWKQHLINYSSNEIAWEKVKCEAQQELLAIIGRENEKAVEA